MAALYGPRVVTDDYIAAELAAMRKAQAQEPDRQRMHPSTPAEHQQRKFERDSQFAQRQEDYRQRMLEAAQKVWRIKSLF